MSRPSEHLEVFCCSAAFLLILLTLMQCWARLSSHQQALVQVASTMTQLASRAHAFGAWSAIILCSFWDASQGPSQAASFRQVELGCVDIALPGNCLLGITLSADLCLSVAASSIQKCQRMQSVKICDFFEIGCYW